VHLLILLNIIYNKFEWYVGSDNMPAGVAPHIQSFLRSGIRLEISANINTKNKLNFSVQLHQLRTNQIL